jgi:hypothetical protein
MVADRRLFKRVTRGVEPRRVGLESREKEVKGKQQTTPKFDLNLRRRGKESRSCRKEGGKGREKRRVGGDERAGRDNEEEERNHRFGGETDQNLKNKVAFPFASSENNTHSLPTSSHMLACSLPLR